MRRSRLTQPQSKVPHESSWMPRWPAWPRPSRRLGRAGERALQIIEPAQRRTIPRRSRCSSSSTTAAHCRDFYPLITAWKKRAAGRRRLPRGAGGVEQRPAERSRPALFYAAQITGDLTALEPAIFAAVQDDKRQLFNEQQGFRVGRRQGWAMGEVRRDLQVFRRGSMVQRADQLARAEDPGAVHGGRRTLPDSASLTGSRRTRSRSPTS